VIHCACGTSDKTTCNITAAWVDANAGYPMLYISTGKAINAGDIAMYLDANGIVSLARELREALLMMTEKP